MNVWNEFLRAVQPGRARQADIESQQHELAMQTGQQQNLKSLVSTARSVIDAHQGDPEITKQVMAGLSQQPLIKQYFGQIKTGAGQLVDPRTPIGISLEEQGQANRTAIANQTAMDTAAANVAVATAPSKIRMLERKAIDDPLDRANKIAKLLDTNMDVNTGKPLEPDLDAALRQQLKDSLGIQTGGHATTTEAQPVNLAQLLSNAGQDQKRTGWGWFGDDTISQGAVRDKATAYVRDLVAGGMKPEQAQQQAANEYNDLLAKEKKNWFKTYPEVDLKTLFDDQARRTEAVEAGQVVTDTGDGVKTAPKPLPSIGIADPNEQEQFATLEKMVGQSMPGFDLRADYAKDPDFYKKLFEAIQKGVPDGNTGKRRTLTTKEIIDLIQGQ
ncbi:MAG: hypothetical protein JXB18_06335 [Sedimentisphaerales bacterium]|nr:hypothetical protein [Sedimentisphaerales bacterium]